MKVDRDAPAQVAVGRQFYQCGTKPQTVNAVIMTTNSSKAPIRHNNKHTYHVEDDEHHDGDVKGLLGHQVKEEGLQNILDGRTNSTN